MFQKQQCCQHKVTQAILMKHVCYIIKMELKVNTIEYHTKLMP